MTPGAASFAPLRAWWRGLAVRERRMVALGAAVLGGYALLAFAVLPAWHRIASAPARLDALDARIQAMQALAAEARALRATPPLAAAQALAALQAATARLGDKGRLSIQGDRAVLSLSGVDGTQLRDWLAEVRSGARARPLEAQITRGASGYAGTVTLALGAAS
ncbi:MAG: type II secretion system protein M [Burkholderiales bacterium]|nr:type II secretion system protein M [Burkholderiales bacterium]